MRHVVVFVMLPGGAKNNPPDTWLCFHFTLSRMKSQLQCNSRNRLQQMVNRLVPELRLFLLRLFTDSPRHISKEQVVHLRRWLRGLHTVPLVLSLHCGYLTGEEASIQLHGFCNTLVWQQCFLFCKHTVLLHYLLWCVSLFAFSIFVMRLSDWHYCNYGIWYLG